MSARTATIVVIGAIAACGDPAARLSLVPIALPSADPANPCGRPAAADVSAIRVIAYTPAGELRRTDTEIDDFPTDTEQLGLEIVGAQGAVIATGKTAPLAYGSLASGTQIPIAVIPPDGFCQANPMTAPRQHPLLVRAGDGVLVLGGGSGSASAEYYDPATASFATVVLPDLLVQDPDALAGVSAATLADGRVAVSDGELFAVFDPTSQTFLGLSAIGCRASHASFGLDASHVLIAGGVEPAACNGGTTAPLYSVLAYAIDAAGAIIGNGVAEPPLPQTGERAGGQLIDLGTVADGSRRLVLAGATSDPSTADQLPITPDATGQVTTATGMHAQVAALDGGAILAALELDGTAQTGSASSLAPDGSAATPIADAPAWDGARVIVAEDGGAYAIGGSDDASVARYDATRNAWDTHIPDGDAPGPLAAPSLALLPDGSVLVVGGGPTATTDAWLYRPSIVGPASGQVFALQNAAGVLTPSDESTATRAGQTMTLVAPFDDSELTARALIGGPRIATAQVAAEIRVTGTGGVALIAQQTAPARALVAKLIAGSPAVIERHVGSAVTPLCTGDSISASDLASVSFTVTATSASAAVGAPGSSVTKVSCDFSNDPIAPERGLWGIAALAGASVEVDTIDVARNQ